MIALVRAAAAGLVLLATLSTASAQERNRFDVGGALQMATFRELDTQDVGVSGRIAWRPVPLLGVEAEVAFYPSNLPDERPVSRRRTEAMFGVTVGPRLGLFRPFVRVRPGVFRVHEAPAPFPCILIYPPPLACTLGAGATQFMLDVGGGLEVDVTPRTFLRVDVGDRAVRFDGPAIARDRTVRTGAFTSHDLRVGVGAGWRF